MEEMRVSFTTAVEGRVDSGDCTWCWEPFVIPYLNGSTILDPPSNSCIKNLFCAHEALPCLRRITFGEGLEDARILEIFLLRVVATNEGLLCILQNYFESKARLKSRDPRNPYHPILWRHPLNASSTSVYPSVGHPIATRNWLSLKPSPYKGRGVIGIHSW